MKGRQTEAAQKAKEALDAILDRALAFKPTKTPGTRKRRAALTKRPR